jgi:LacI family transcriptional regulator
MIPPRKPPHVALLVETSLASGRDILRGIARFARECGPWSLYHAPRGLDESAPDWLRRWKGDGILARVTSPELARLLRSTRLPVVDVLGKVAGTPFPLVHVDNAAIGRMAFQHLAERGFRRFAFVGIAGENWSAQRRDAFLDLARRVDAGAALFESAAGDREQEPWERRQERLAAWVRALPKPAGIMVCSDQRGSDVLEACLRAGVPVPGDVAVVGVDNDETLCEVCQPPLSSVCPHHAAVGYEAAARLADLMAQPARNKGEHRRFVPPRQVITRQSTDMLAVEDRAIATALRYIREHACEGPSVDEVARQAGTSRSVLQRRFRHLLGRTVHDQLLDERIKRASGLIAGTGLPLAEIAERCGFRHQEYMGAVFRSRLGRTPAAMRRG